MPIGHSAQCLCSALRLDIPCADKRRYARMLQFSLMDKYYVSFRSRVELTRPASRRVR